MGKQSLSIFNYSLKNSSNEAVDIFIDGFIVDAPTQEFYKEYWNDDTSVSYKSLRNQIDNSGAKKINIYINSGGGSVIDAMAIHDMIIEKQNNGIEVNTFGRGIIASAATYILMAGKNSTISENSWFMIHNVSGGAWGDVNEMENAAKTLRKFNNQVRDFYASATGLPAETISAWMNKETWFTGSEAKEKGFVKNTEAQKTFSNAINPDHWYFQNKNVLQAYNSFTQKNNEMNIEAISKAIETGFANLMEKVGLKDKKEETQEALNSFTESIVNAINEALPSPEAMQNKINEAVANALKDVITMEAVNTAVAEATKNVITKADLDAATEKLTNSFAAKLGNKTGDDSGKDRKTSNKKPSRFSNVQFWSN